MTVKCTFCNDTKIEPGIPGPCVWCEQVGAALVAVGYQFGKGFTDPVGDCEKFEAGIHVNAWAQRIVVYGDTPTDAEKLRDHIMLSAEREAALREDLEQVKSRYDREVLGLNNEGDPIGGDPAGGYKNDNARLQQRLTVVEKRAGELEAALKFYADGDHLLLADADAWDTCSGEPVNFLHDEAGTASVEDGSIAKAALKPSAEGEVS